MPIAIGQIDSTVLVDGERGAGEGEPDARTAELPARPEAWRWAQLARVEAERQARTSAWGFDD